MCVFLKTRSLTLDPSTTGVVLRPCDGPVTSEEPVVHRILNSDLKDIKRSHPIRNENECRQLSQVIYHRPLPQ